MKGSIITLLGICINIQLNQTKDILKKLQRVELIRDAIFLYIKFALSRGIYWQGLEQARRMPSKKRNPS